jgi:hypothetical protein
MAFGLCIGSGPGGLSVSTSAPSGDPGFARREAPERTAEAGDATRPAPVRIETVYDAVLELLTARGWVQGRQAGGGRLSLTAAIDTVVGVDVATGAADGPRLARSARIGRHLRELAGAASLTAWNDAQSRTMGDVTDLLGLATVAYPDD